MDSPTLKNNRVIISLVFPLIFLLVLDFSLSVSSNSTEEAHALVKWKASLEVHSRSLLHSWSLSSVNATKISPCAWSGIHCNYAGRVVGINLTSISLNGIIPRCFEEMRGLLHIDISYNKLEGRIPNSTTFRDAPLETLQENKGLCGDIRGFPSCMSHKKASRKIWTVILFPLLGMVAFVIALTGMFFIFRQRKNDSQTQQSSFGNTLGLLSVLTFEGKIVYEEIIRATNDFDAKHCIGKGGHGSVYKATVPSGEIFAVKKFHSSLPGEMSFQQEEFLNEIKALIEIRHRNIVKFYGLCSHPRHSFIVYEYLECGSLDKILSNDALAKELGWTQRLNVIKGVADADKSIPKFK